MPYPYYVLDTNVLVDYPDIIPGENSKPPKNPTVDLSEAHVVIPSAVTRELSSFKKDSDRGRAARTVLGRIRELTENNIDDPISITDTYNITEFAVPNTNMFLSVIPIRKDFKEYLPFCPSEDDMDGQIILAALSVEFALTGRLNGDLGAIDVGVIKPSHVVLLTNDNGLAIRAFERGIKTSRYSHKSPPAYTGRRNVTVPPDLFKDFINNHRISLEDWTISMPNEPDLVANEFIVMSPEGGEMPPGYDIGDDNYYTYIGRYDIIDEGIVSLQYVSKFPLKASNVGQAIYAEALMHPDIDVTICTGPAGSGKTYMAAIYSLMACKEGKYIDTVVIPCQIEDDGVGYLPGDLEEKLDPNVQPIKNAIRNYLIETGKDIIKQLKNRAKFNDSDEKKYPKDPERNSNSQSNKSIKSRLDDLIDLTWDNWFSSMAISYARGLDFTKRIAFYDEFQDQNRTQADTLLKRLGKEGKIIITGDIEQIHAAYLDRDNNGLTYARELVKGFPMVAQVTFIEDEVVRSDFVKLITQRQSK